MTTQSSGNGNGHNRLSVGVLVDLYREPSAGGHVKCWERLAEATTGQDVDLTVYFLGDNKGAERVSENVRYVTVKPVLSTDLFPFLDGVAAHTDLIPLNPGLFAPLRKHHVLHTTDAYFAMARTALLCSRWAGRPLVNSIHSDTPGYTRVYSTQVFRRLFGEGRISRLVLERWHWQERLARRKERRLQRYQARCDWTLDALGEMPHAPIAGNGRSSALRRGIDRDLFHPAKRDRRRLAAELGIGENQFVLLCAGRVDAGKDVMTLARAARILADRGFPVHTIFAGEGAQADEVRRLLDGHVTLTGIVSQAELAWLYASADLFVFPSRIEISPNVVLEAKASGVPVVVSAYGGSRRMVHEPGRDGVIVESGDSFVWAETIEALLRDPDRRRNVSAASRQLLETDWPSWRQVLEQDLLPVWQRVARERGVWH